MVIYRIDKERLPNIEYYLAFAIFLLANELQICYANSSS